VSRGGGGVGTSLSAPLKTSILASARLSKPLIAICDRKLGPTIWVGLQLMW
jgi:hypothetical protein